MAIWLCMKNISIVLSYRIGENRPKNKRGEISKRLRDSDIKIAGGKIRIRH